MDKLQMMSINMVNSAKQGFSPNCPQFHQKGDPGTGAII